MKFPVVWRQACRVIGLVLLLLTSARPASADEITWSATVDFGADHGQSFGSLFEARDDQGRVVAGAGFADVYNTRFRSDRHTLQFFVRPSTDAEEFTVERLPHPDLDCGVYLMDLDQRLYAWTGARGNLMRLLDSAGNRWLDELPPRMSGQRSGHGAMRVGSGVLVFGGSGATFDGRQILGPPDVGVRYNFYYAHGHLFFFHTLRGDDGFTKIYACPWTSDDEGTIDLSDAIVIDAKYVGATPFAWGQFRHEALTVTNHGGIHVFDGKAWRTILEADNTTSYQIYSMLNYHDRLLLAQYPTGHLFEYQGVEAKHIDSWPPRLPGASPSAREAQTMGVYRGDLMVGVWPWAELWRRDRDAEKWISMGRMFTHPEVSDKTVHPYEAEATRFDLVLNHWGQRITSMVPRGDSLMLATSSKGTYEWFDKYDFLTDKQRREYGAVLRLKMPGNLAAQVKWTDGPTKLDFVVTSDRMIVRQDGQQLAAVTFTGMDRDRTRDVAVKWGDGVFGSFSGKIASESTPTSP